MKNIKEFKDYNKVNLEEFAQEHIGKKKIKKFFRIATPILIIEILLAVALGVYLLILPKNYCKINVDNKDAIIYVNGKETNRFRFTNPKEKTNFYYYEVDVSIKFPAGKDYLITYTVECDDYIIYVSTSAPEKKKVYSLNVKGGKKTQLFSGLTLKSDTLIEDFDVFVNINVQS